MLGAGVAEAGGPSLYLTAEDLTGAGLHLPSYMPTVDGLMAYQERLPFHQMLVVRWDARPGAREMVLKEEADKTPLSPDFVLLKRDTKMPGAVGKTQRPIRSGAIVVVAIDAAKQIRGLAIQPESLEVWLEDLPQRKGWRYIMPNVTIYARLPDDPQIQTVMFFSPTEPDQSGNWKLKQVGSLPLPSTRAAGGQ